jgi:hypothetical protein
MTARLVIRRRPPRRLRGSRGSSGSILAHCASVKKIIKNSASEGAVEVKKKLI